MYPWMVPMCESIHGYMGTGMLWVWVWVSPQVPAGLPMQNPRHSAPGKDVSTADIVMLCVLVPPHASAAPQCSPPLKRRVSAYIHPDASPTKCSRA